MTRKQFSLGISRGRWHSYRKHLEGFDEPRLDFDDLFHSDLNIHTVQAKSLPEPLILDRIEWYRVSDLDFPLPSRLRSWIEERGIKLIRFVGGGVAGLAPYVGPGDVLGANMFTAYWGFRAFSSATVGTRAVQLRRSSDSAVQDFVTLPNGKLDTNAIAFFQKGANLTVATMYDQTGNGHTMVPTNSTFEQAFLPNTLNGMGVFANPNRNATAYRTNTTFPILNTWSNCFYSVFKVAATAPGLFQNICACGDDEVGLVADRDADFNSVTVKNEGAGGLGGLDLSPPPQPVPEGVWHAGVGIVNQNGGSTSFLMVDSQIHSGSLVGNPNVSLATICMWGEDGLGPNTNCLQGYAAETAWFATPTPNSPWTQAQATSLISNAQKFWGI